MNNEQKKQAFWDEYKEYFKGGFSMVDEDMPDGAYGAMLVEVADQLLGDIHTICEDIEIPAGLDGHDIVYSHYFAEPITDAT